MFLFLKIVLKGDSGGPLTCRVNGSWTVVGIVSYGDIDCATSGSAAVYTRVSSYRQWILDVMNNCNENSVDELKNNPNCQDLARPIH